MGCIGSKLDINDVHPNIFTVLRVNEFGGRIPPPGQIQITDSELVLHQKGKDPTRWPLRSLRRYGFEAEKFSFESGRRCVTGPGVYVFDCTRAENLFNLLQHKIRSGGISQDPDGGPSMGSPNPGSLGNGLRSGIGGNDVVPTAADAAGMGGGGDVSLLPGNGSLGHRSSLPSAGNGRSGRASISQISITNGFNQRTTDFSEGGAPTYVNVNCDSEATTSFINSTPGGLLYNERVAPLHPDFINPDTPSHQYENVTPGCQNSSPLKYPCTSNHQHSSFITQDGHIWDPNAASPMGSPLTTPFTSPPLSPTSPTSLMGPGMGGMLPGLIEKKVCYAQLDLNSTTAAQIISGANGNSNQPGSVKVSADAGIGYSVIDFDKTTALTKTAATRQEYELRKASVANSSISEARVSLSTAD